MEKINSLCIIDDDPIFQFLTRNIVKQSEMVNHIEIFSNGLEAMNFLNTAFSKKEQLPDMILLDLFMPVMDGWVFLDNFLPLQSKLDKQIIIYIISSSNNPSDIEKSKNISAVKGFIVKPITKKKFIKELERLLETPNFDQNEDMIQIKKDANNT